MGKLQSTTKAAHSGDEPAGRPPLRRDRDHEQETAGDVIAEACRNEPGIARFKSDCLSLDRQLRSARYDIAHGLVGLHPWPEAPRHAMCASTPVCPTQDKPAPCLTVVSVISTSPGREMTSSGDPLFQSRQAECPNLFGQRVLDFVNLATIDVP